MLIIELSNQQQIFKIFVTHVKQGKDLKFILFPVIVAVSILENKDQFIIDRTLMAFWLSMFLILMF